MKKIFSVIVFTLIIGSCHESEKSLSTPIKISGIYPHLAYYNTEGECGTGAVVTWADRLWVITYSPHMPHGSSDKLYEITPELKQIIREESIGGTPANRMIHRESNQLFIGPYAIDIKANVRAIPYLIAIGRHTANARHLSNPEELIYLGTMEEGLYEVNVKTLEVSVLYEDGHVIEKTPGNEFKHDTNDMLPGGHGKGMYSGQGVLVYANNGEVSPEALKKFDIESGALAEWDGKDWTLIRRNQFCEVTGPGGIYGNPNPETDPIWATGFDHKSLLLGVRDNGNWSFFRLPKGSHTYDGAHGWNTEWPRIRDIGTSDNPDYLMTMHGMFWKFPENFTSENSAGIRPRSAYLKVIGDFTRWMDQLIFGCDDSAHREFLNKRKAKGGIEGPGQSNSNIWFTSVEKPDKLGPNTASGAVWLQEDVEAGTPSEPFLFTGWPNRTAWINNHDDQAVELTFEVDVQGTGNWDALLTETILAGSSIRMEFSDDQQGEWVRVVSDKNARITVQFTYTARDGRSAAPDKMFSGLLNVSDGDVTGGLLYGLGDDRRALGVSARINGIESGYYELDSEMNLLLINDPETQSFINEKFAIPEKVVTIDKSSVLVIDDKDRRWRLPLGDDSFTGLTNETKLRICREVATERDLFNCHGTFYELPAENADGYAKIRPIASHNFRIHDYASYRGMLIMTGIDPESGEENPHIFMSEDKKEAVWAGTIDDLWKMGKPRGKGGPWKNTDVKSGDPSDPYLIGFYDKKSLSINHDLEEDVKFIIEVDPVGYGPWMEYLEVKVSAGETFDHIFPDGFQARWIRFKTDKDCNATAWLDYK
ncbi:hypothetical protein ACFLU5_01825 [Bacteroidota bacterium]